MKQSEDGLRFLGQRIAGKEENVSEIKFLRDKTIIKHETFKNKR